MKKPTKKNLVNKDAAHELHALLDYLLTQTTITGQSQAYRFSVPYNLMGKPDPSKVDVRLIIEIHTYWDGKERISEHSDSRAVKVPSKNPTRH